MVGGALLKTLFVIILVSLIAGSGWWYAGASTTERMLAGWLEDRRAEGWLVNYEGLDTSGYPTQFATVIAELQLADPETGWAWTAPEFRLTQSSYRPDQIRADWPPTQTLASPFERLDIVSAAIWAELDIQPANNLALDASSTVMQDVRIDSTEGWSMALSEGQVQVMRQDGQEATYDVLFEAQGMSPPQAVRTRLDPAGLLPEAIEVARYEAVMAFDRPWNLSAVERARPQITTLDLQDLRAEWGEMLLRASGALDVDAEGRASGELAVRAENWQAMLEMAARSGVLTETLARGARSALGFLSGMSGRPEDLDATLRLQDGFVFLGPLPIGEAPRLILR